VTYNQSISVMK